MGVRYAINMIPFGVWHVVKLRLKRFGRTHSPFYRLTAMDQRSARDSRSIEELGHFAPLEKDPEKQISFNADRIKYWLSVGAQPSDTVRSLIKRAGIDHKVGQAVESQDALAVE